MENNADDQPTSFDPSADGRKKKVTTVWSQDDRKQIPIRSIQQRELDMEEIAHLLARGYTIERIAMEKKWPTSRVERDWTKLRNRSIKIANAEVKALVWQKMKELEEVKIEAWKQYEASKLPSEKVVTDVSRAGNLDENGELATDSYENSPSYDEDDAQSSGKLGGNGYGSKRVTTTTQNRTGDPRYLTLIKDVIADERELLGLNAPKRVDVKTTNVNWEIIAQDMQATILSAEELIEQQLGKRMQLPASAIVQEAMSRPAPEDASTDADDDDGEDEPVSTAAPTPPPTPTKAKARSLGKPVPKGRI